MSKCHLKELFNAIGLEPSQLAECGRSTELICRDVVFDSRAVQPGSLFVAIAGDKFDGHRYINQAGKAGAVAVVAQTGCIPQTAIAEADVPIFCVPDTRLALSQLADCVYGQPSRKMKCVGITGTNGKTSVAWITANLFALLGAPCGVLGTLGTTVLNNALLNSNSPSFSELPNTTPDPLSIHGFLASALGEGAQAAVIEATSQGIAQYRTANVDWDCSVFTNLSRDHLELHGSMETYAEQKFRLFSEELARSSSETATAVLWLDDPVAQLFYQRLSSHAELRLLGVAESAKNTAYRVQNPTCRLNGTEFELSINTETAHFRSALLGRYNIANLAISLSVLHSFGYSLSELAEVIPDVPAVPGRLQPVSAADVHVFVDYSHTPDSLINAQNSLREIGSGRLITVFGCGGDRDKGKRPLMGQAVAELSDYGVVTSDNPRSEDPEQIVKEVLPGLKLCRDNNAFEWRAEVDRRKAIELAVDLAQPGDMVLVAGKGHEPYQEVDGVRHYFLDSEVCSETLAKRRIS